MADAEFIASTRTLLPLLARHVLAGAAEGTRVEGVALKFTGRVICIDTANGTGLVPAIELDADEVDTSLADGDRVLVAVTALPK